MNIDPVIVFQNVSFSYGEHLTLENVDFTVRERELISIVGPNGGGKTTLLRLILNRIKPLRGKIRVFGRDAGAALSRIGYMPQHQQFDPLFPADVMDVVLMGRIERHMCGPYSRADKDAALSALTMLDAGSLARRSFADLSGGQRQRVLIARALVSEPDLLLLDEPTAGIDSTTGIKLTEILRELNKRMTIVLVSHDLAFVSDIVQTVICVNREVMVHPTSEITGEIIQRVYNVPLRMIRHDHRCSELGHEWRKATK